MLLVIDCGNTNIVFALYDKDMQVACWRISSDSRRGSDEYAVWLTQLMTSKNFDFQALIMKIRFCGIIFCGLLEVMSMSLSLEQAHPHIVSIGTTQHVAQMPRPGVGATQQHLAP